MMGMAKHIMVLLLLMFNTAFAVNSEVTISASFTHILLTWPNINVNETVVYKIVIENGPYFNSIEICDPRIPTQIGLLPSSTAFNVSVTRTFFQKGESSTDFQQLQTIWTLKFPSFGWRYDSCSGKIRFRWDLPPSIPRNEAKLLSLIYRIKGNDTKTYYKAAFLDLTYTIESSSTCSEISIDVILAPLSYKINWPFTDPPIVAVGRIALDASECTEEMFISTSLTAIRIEWNPHSFAGNLTIVLAPLIGTNYFVEVENSGSIIQPKLPPGSEFNLIIEGPKQVDRYNTTYFKYTKAVRTKTMEIYDTKFNILSYCLSDRIVLEWTPPNYIPEPDIMHISVIVKIGVDMSTSWYHWKPLSAGYAVFKHINSSQIYSLEIRLGPWTLANRHQWWRLKEYRSYNFATNDAAECSNEIMISSTLTSIKIEWNQYAFLGPLNIIWEKTPRQYHNISSKTGAEMLTHLSPATEFQLTAIGMRQQRRSNSTTNFQYISSVRTKTLDAYTKTLKFNSHVFSDHIVFSWNPLNTLPEHDTADLSVIFQVRLDDGTSWFHSTRLNARYAVLKHLRPNTKHFVDIRLAPWPYGNDFLWPGLRRHLSYIINTSKKREGTELGGHIGITSTLTTIKFMWAPGEYSGTLKFLLESEISSHQVLAERNAGSKKISELPPGTLFAVKVMGTRLMGTTENPSYYSSVVLTKTVGATVQTFSFPNRIKFYWDHKANVPREDIHDFFLIFKITQNDVRIGFYWQWFNANHAELYPLHSNSSYRVEVGFGPLKYASESLWTAIQSHYSYVTTTTNLDYRVMWTPHEPYKMKWIDGHKVDTYE